MNKDRALELKKFAETIADRFSNFNRDGNQNKETFSVKEVIPVSDDAAVINFQKTSNLKFYLINISIYKSCPSFI